MKLRLANNKILPFYFAEFEDDYLVTNLFKEYIFLKKGEFSQLISGEFTDEKLLNVLTTKNFIYEGEDELIAEKYGIIYKEQNSFLFSATSLHIFAVTQNCNLNCVYCQVTSNMNTHKNTLMTKEIARKSVDIALESPSHFLAFEFQGGEPLLNFPVIKEIVNYAKKRNNKKKIEYRLVTNLTLMTDEILDFIEENKISISISLDGDEYIQNMNRPYKNGKGSFEKVIYWIEKIRNRKNIIISALPTITKESLSRIDELLETYISLGFKNIFIRSLSPFGSATANWDNIGYSASEFSLFYEKILDKIISYNTDEIVVTENYAAMVLEKILNKTAVNFMDLRSPCGAGIGQIAYNWDGNIYTCDEGRMLSVEGDQTFKIGNISEDNYQSCMQNENLEYVLSASVLDSVIECSDCVYSPICGICPVYNYKTQGKLFIPMTDDFRCNVFKGIYKSIYSKLKSNDPETMKILLKWVQ
ncbi:MAG: His-Xaa-Ser system radical SAM maturase HxsB [Ignavibacteriales bacterium]|nr:His-Xaa-Ser system radical SAM maturase HxsB [Ignavibacteriales bacterium]MCF8435921.1 His-Xaa-Ser system radical SAM maturase HxsB [Ignavibacteriales bacterium]